MLDFDEVSGETSEILSDPVMKIFENHKLMGKVISYCVDNTNNNLSGVKRQDKINVFTKLQNRLASKF